MNKQLAVVFGATALLTMLMAWPVVRSPRTHIFGDEIVGRHGDPFVVMQQFDTGHVPGPYWQPLTDVPGALLARIVGPIAAYNIMVLVTFPLAAVAMFALARYLNLGAFASAVSAIAFTFTPFHVAHAAYHPHIAQVQWFPVYLLALIACVDRPTLTRAVALAIATTGVALSNFYGGLIAGIMTIVALPAYWLATSSRPIRFDRRVAVPLLTLALLVAGAYGFVRMLAPQVWLAPRTFAVPFGDLLSFSATWWAYLAPSVEHPFLGGLAQELWARSAIGTGLLEQQVSISWGLLGLAVVGVVLAIRRRSGLTRPVAIAFVIIAAWAWLCSLAPLEHGGVLTLVRPSTVAASLLPMFRAYARFGVVVALVAALFAGAGAEWLRSRSSRAARVTLVALMALASVDSAPIPWRARDVLPTSAHRWIANQPTARTLDCTASSPAEAEVPWLMHDRVTMRSGMLNDCTDPSIATTLAALGYTDMIVRGGRQRPLVRQVAAIHGLALVESAEDGQVFAVTEPRPIVATIDVQGFDTREGDASDSWRWMGPTGFWRVINTSAQSVVAQLDVDLASFPGDRHVRVQLDDLPITPDLDVHRQRSIQTIGPLTLRPGEHTIRFRTAEPASRPDDELHNGDTRAVTLRFGHWQWRVRTS